MNPICHLRQRALSRLAVLGEDTSHSLWLAGHVRKCESCGVAWTEYRRLTEALSSAELQTPMVSQDVAERVWNRVSVAPRLSTWSRGVLAVCGTALFAVAVITPFVLRTLSATAVDNGITTPATGRGPQNPGPVIAKRLQSPQTPDRVIQKKPQRVVDVDSGNNRQRHKIRPLIRARVVYASATKRSPEPAHPVAAKSFSVPDTTTWLTWAQAYEAQGEYEYAAKAYAYVAERSPDPGLAYQAGRASEYAGDTLQAVEYYARALKSARSERPQHEKGTSLWNYDHISA